MSMSPAASPQTSSVADSKKPLLEVRNLKVHFPTKRGFLGLEKGLIRAVDGVSFEIFPGETLGIVGESGCGKSTTARAIVHLNKPTSGEIWFQGKRIDWLAERSMREVRRDMQMIFQDPYASLNPRMTVGAIITEPMAIFGIRSRRDRQLEAMRLMELVGLNPRFINRYPHEFSGGQRQRIGVARALAVEPKLIVCDEPVSALDVSIQAQVINLLMDLQQQFGIAYMFIAHDLAVVRHIAHRVGVMYLGRIVELASSADLYSNPRHPYTQALLSAAPVPDPDSERNRERVELKGEPPSPDREYPGCPFYDRCPIGEQMCVETVPRLEGGDHQAACLKAENGKPAPTGVKL